MDIKLKKFNDKFSVRALAFVLCITLLLVSGTWGLIGLKKISDIQSGIYGIDISDLTQADEYYNSEFFKNWLNESVNSMGIINKYKSREDIKAGKYIDEKDVYNELEIYYEDIIIYDGYDESVKKYFTTENEGQDSPEYDDYVAKPFDDVKEEYAKDNPKTVKSIRNSIMAYQLGEYDNALDELNRIDFVSYKIGSGDNAISQNNMDGDGKDVGFTLTIDKKGDIKTNPEIKNLHISSEDNASYVNNSTLEMELKISSTSTNALSDNFLKAKEVFSEYSIVVVTTFIAFLLVLIYLCIVTGRRDDEGNVILYRSDKLYTEIQFLILFGLCALVVLPIVFTVRTLGDLSSTIWSAGNSNIAILIAGIGAELIVTSALLWFALSIIRMIKGRIFISRSLIVIAVKEIYKWIKAAFSRANPMGKFVIIIIVACLMSMTIVLAPIAIILLLGFGYRWISKYTEVKKGVEEVNSGNLEYKIPVEDKDNTEFDILARQINSISMASNVAIQNELKNQRLKTDLISNVSHDLKTPLTSIITYTDLLKKEGPNSPNAESYLNVIDEKGQRLKALTEDLFEAAKASSGSIPVRLEKVDLLSLINQGLVELDEGLKAKGLDIIVNGSNEKYYVNADSQLLWRVVENLLNNIEKYALENSRVYIDLSEKELSTNNTKMTIFEMKNMSKAPLNIPEEELMERFKRGDESRTAEGSGLGLAIAKDLTRLQNGVFELKIDGDLFKSTVMLQSFNEDTIKKAQDEARQKEAVEDKIHGMDVGPGMPKIEN